MLLRSIKVEGWRCFANPVTVGEFGDGLNIVHGPNGSGKSTLMMALVRAMFDGHHAAGQDVESLRPWGKDLSPLVELQFEHAATHYRLSKGFLGRKQCELSRREHDRFERFKEARDADDFLRSLLAGEETKRGHSKPQHWGLAQVLWVPQGDLTLQSLTGTAKDMVQQALGAQLASVASSSVERRVKEQYDAIFTATGKLKQGAGAARVVVLEQQVAESSARLTALQERLQAFETASRRMEDLRRTAEQSLHREQGLSATIESARTRSREYSECSNRCDLRRQELNTARAKTDDARARLETITSARRDLSGDEVKLARLQADYPLLQTAVAHDETCVQQTRAHAEQVRLRRQEIDAARRQAHDAAALSDASRKLAQLATQIAAIEAAQKELTTLRETRTGLVAPTPKQLSALRKAQADVREARLRLEGSLITLTFVAEGAGVALQTLAGEPTGEQQVAPGQRVIVRGSPEAALSIVGVGIIRASGPASSADQLRAELGTAEANWLKLSTGWGQVSLEELDQTLQEAQALDQEIARVETRLSTTLGDRTAEQLRTESMLEQRRRDDICARQPAWSESPPSSQELHALAEQLEQSFRVQIDEAEAKVDAARSAHTASQRKLSAHEADINATLARIAGTQKRLEQLTTDGRDDACRQADYEDLLLQFDLAKARLTQAENELKAFQADPRKELGILEQEQTAVRQQRDKALEALHREDALLQQLASEAPYSAVATADEELVQLKEQLARERLRTEAVKLLHDTLAAVQCEAVQTVIEPVKRRAQQTLQRIGGGKFDGISFDEELLPTGVQPQSCDQTTVSLEHLSGGEREQVYFAVRLALADVAFRGSRELLVLDDVFVYTDMGRVARIVTILEEVAERFQIVLFTCHPERYRGLPQAKFFDLAELVRGESSSSPPPADQRGVPKPLAKSAASKDKASDRSLWESVEP